MSAPQAPEVKHTPLPWLLRDIATTTGFGYVVANKIACLEISSEASVCWVAYVQIHQNIGQDGRANAEFIVRACNSHYKLLEALKAQISGKMLGPSPAAIHPSRMFCTVCGTNSDEFLHVERCPIKIAEDAIAEAEASR